MKRKTEGDSGMEPREKKAGDPFPWSLEAGNDDDKMVIAFSVHDWTRNRPPAGIVNRVQSCLQAAVNAGYYDHLKRTTGTRVVSLDQLSDFKFINIKTSRFSSKTRIDCIITDQSAETTIDLLIDRALPQSLIPELILYYFSPETHLAAVDDGKKLWRGDNDLLFASSGLAFHFPKVNTVRPVRSTLPLAYKPGELLVNANDFAKLEGVGYIEAMSVDRKLYPTKEALKKGFPAIPPETVKTIPWDFLHEGEVTPLKADELKGLVPVIVHAHAILRSPPGSESKSDANFLVDVRVYVRFIDAQKAAPWKAAAGMRIFAAHPIFKRNLFAKILYNMDDPLAIRTKSNVRALSSFISSKYPSQ